jgi:hypothetical protein
MEAKEQLRTRGSSADREIHCAGAIGYDGPRIDETGPEAMLGMAADEALGEHVAGGSPNLDAIADVYGVDRDMLGMAFSGGKTVWGKVRGWFEGYLHVQRRLDGLTTCGTADVVAIDQEGDPIKGYGAAFDAAILDWKLGMSDDQHVNQGKAYVLALWDEYDVFPTSGYILFVEAHLMPAVFFVHKFTQAQLEEFRSQLERQHRQAGKQFAPGDWCKYCPISHDCEERDKYLRSACTALGGVAEKGIAPRELVGQLWYRSRDVGRAWEAYNKAVGLLLATGPIPLPGGGVLDYEMGETDVIDAETLHVVLDRIALDPWAAMVTSKEAIKRVLKAHAAAEKKAGRKFNQARVLREIMADLDAEEGVSKKTTKTVRVIK